jgi:hypothetical protein
VVASKSFEIREYNENMASKPESAHTYRDMHSPTQAMELFSYMYTSGNNRFQQRM